MVAHSLSPSPSSTPARGVKREADSSPSPSEKDTKLRKRRGPKSRTTSTANKAPPRKWTPDELDALLTIALKHGASTANFEGQIPGRTANQCMRTWLITIVPFLHKAVREKGGAKE